MKQSSSERKVTVSICLAPAELAAVRQIAAAEDRAPSAVVRLLVRKALGLRPDGGAGALLEGKRSNQRA